MRNILTHRGAPSTGWPPHRRIRTGPESLKWCMGDRPGTANTTTMRPSDLGMELETSLSLYVPDLKQGGKSSGNASRRIQYCTQPCTCCRPPADSSHPGSAESKTVAGPMLSNARAGRAGRTCEELLRAPWFQLFFFLSSPCCFFMCVGVCLFLFSVSPSLSPLSSSSSSSGGLEKAQAPPWPRRPPSTQEMGLSAKQEVSLGKFLTQFSLVVQVHRPRLCNSKNKPRPLRSLGSFISTPPTN